MASSPPTDAQEFISVRAIARLGGPDIAAKIWDTIEKKRSGK